MRRAILMGFGAILLAGSGLAQSATPTSDQQNDQPSLAELAAKNKKAKAAKKVITNEDIPERPADSTSSTGNGSGGSVSGSGTAAAGTDAAADEKSAKGKGKGEK